MTRIKESIKIPEMAEATFGAVLAFYGSAFEAAGAACFNCRSKIMNAPGILLSLNGGVACIIGAQVIPAHVFTSVQALSIPTAIILSGYLAQKPTHVTWPGVIALITGVMMVIHGSRSMLHVEPPFPMLFWFALTVTTILGVINSLILQLKWMAIGSAAVCGALTLAIVDLGFPHWVFYPLVVIVGATDLYLNAFSIKLNTTSVHTPLEYALWNFHSLLFVGPYVRNEVPRFTVWNVIGIGIVVTSVFVVVHRAKDTHHPPWRRDTHAA